LSAKRNSLLARSSAPPTGNLWESECSSNFVGITGLSRTYYKLLKSSDGYYNLGQPMPFWFYQYGKVSIEMLQLALSTEHDNCHRFRYAEQVGSPENYAKGLLGFKSYFPLAPGQSYFKSKTYPGWYFIVGDLSPSMKSLVFRIAMKNPKRVFHICGCIHPMNVRI